VHEVLYHHVKLAGARTSPGAAELSFLFVCLCVHHAFELRREADTDSL